jgi:hypothetical protein
MDVYFLVCYKFPLNGVTAVMHLALLETSHSIGIVKNTKEHRTIDKFENPNNHIARILQNLIVIILNIT